MAKVLTQITSITFDKSVFDVTPNNQIAVTVKIKNVSGYTLQYLNMDITMYCCINVQSSANYIRYILAETDNGYTANNISWANNTTKTIKLTLTHTVRNNPTIINDGIFPVGEYAYMRIDGYAYSDAHISDLDYSNYEMIVDYGHLYDDYGLIVRVSDPATLVKWDKPCAFERCDYGGTVNEEGEYVLTSASLYRKDTIDTDAYDQALTVYVNGEYHQNISDKIGSMLYPQGAINDGSIITSRFDKSNQYSVSFVYTISSKTCGFEYSVTTNGLIARSFANVHLSGASTGGVAFGKFSASTENNPMFECVYPAKMLGGLYNVQTGVVDFGTISANGSKNVSVTFEHEYAEPPVVLMNPYVSSSSNAAVAKMPVHACNDSVTATGFTARCVNGDSSSHNRKGTWLAFGIPKV